MMAHQGDHPLPNGRPQSLPSHKHGFFQQNRPTTDKGIIMKQDLPKDGGQPKAVIRILAESSGCKVLITI